MKALMITVCIVLIIIVFVLAGKVDSIDGRLSEIESKTQFIKIGGVK